MQTWMWKATSPEESRTATTELSSALPSPLRRRQAISPLHLSDSRNAWSQARVGGRNLHVAHRPPGQLLALVTGHAHESAVDRDNALERVADENAIAAGIEHAGRDLQLALIAQALGDVRVRTQDPHGRAIFRVLDHAAREHGQCPA